MTDTKNPFIQKIVDNAKFLGNFENNTPEWHELRDELGVISGSEIGAILGLSPFKSAFTLWAEKTGKVTDGFEQNIAMRVGQLVEPAIFQLFTEQHPDYLVETVGTYAHKNFAWAHCNPDGVGFDANGQPFILEIKHTSQYWDSIPENYYAQVLWYMWIFDVKKAVFAVLNGGRYKEFEVAWDEFYFAAILEKIMTFRNCLLEDKRPVWDGSESTYETMRSLTGEIEDTREELGQLGIELFNAQRKVKEAETHLNEMKSRTLDALAGAKYGTIEGKTVVTLSQRAGGKPYLTIKEN